MPPTPQSGQVKSIGTLFMIVEQVQAMDGGTVTEISNEVNIAKSTVYNHLETLRTHGYIVKTDDEYHIGLKFLDHGKYAMNRRMITDVSQPRLEQLASETGELVWLVVEEHGEAVYLQNALGEQAVQTRERVGSRCHMHCLASGKAILAHLPESRVDQIIETHGLPRYTQNTITDREELKRELEEIRSAGVSFNRREEVWGVHSVASPIIVNDTVHGAIVVSGPANRLNDALFTEVLPDIVRGSANDIELRLEYKDATGRSAGQSKFR